MNVLLDTSAYSALCRGHQVLLDAVRGSETIAVSAVALGELHSGFRAGNRCAEETALRYAEIDVYLRKKGRPIPRNDVWIAAVALEHGLQLLTLDVRFREIPLLLIQP